MSKQAPNEFRYIPVEVCLMPTLDKQMRKVFDYGIVKLAKEMFKNMDSTDVMNQAIRAYYDDKLPGDMSDVFDECLSDDHRHFRGYINGEFCGENERQILSDYLSNSESFNDSPFVDPLEEFKQQYLPYSQIHKAMRFLNLNGGPYATFLNNHKAIKRIVDQHEFKHGKDALVMIKTEHFIDFSYNEKTAREWDIFKGFLAIKSIQGNKEFVATNKGLIQARMIGAKTVEIAESLTKDKSLKSLHKCYQERYFFDKLLLRIRGEYHVSEIGAFRKMFLSTQMTDRELATAVVDYAKNIQAKNSDKLKKKEDKILKDWIYNQLKNN